MSKWRQAIYDRTAADIESRTKKAFFNVADWLRIRGNTDQARQLLAMVTGAQVELAELTEPTTTSIPTAAEINALIADIDKLREAADLPASLGLVTLKHDWAPGFGAAAPDYRAVNDWERDLELVRDGLARAADYLVYCGVGAVGQPRFYQARWRRWTWVQPVDTPTRRPRAGLADCGSGLTRQNSWRRY